MKTSPVVSCSDHGVHEKLTEEQKRYALDERMICKIGDETAPHQITTCGKDEEPPAAGSDVDASEPQN